MDHQLPLGYVPRVSDRNYHVVERTVAGMASLFEPIAPRPRWAVVDGSWLAAATSFQAHAGEAGLSYLADTQGWRSRGDPDSLPRRWMELPHAPTGPLWNGDDDIDRAFVVADLGFQARAGAKAYLIPGPLPASPDEETHGAVLRACEAAREPVFAPPLPTFVFLGVHTDNLDGARRTLESLPGWLTGVYVQFTPVAPMKDSVGKSSRLLGFLQEAERAGLHTVAGHLGAIGLLATALGISAADAGIGDAEAFRVQNRLRRGGGGPGKSEEPRGVPRYFDALLRTLDGRRSSTVEAVANARAAVLCGPACCRYMTSEQRTAMSRDHSLRERVRASDSLLALPPSMRLDEVNDRLQRSRAAVQAVNASLVAAGHAPIDAKYLEAQSAILEHLDRVRRSA